MSVRAVAMFMLLMLLICVACSGCTAQIAGATTVSCITENMFGVLSALTVVGVTFRGMFGEWRDGWSLVRWFILGAFMLAVVGCAALPMPLQPVNEQYNSNYAEGGFIVLASVDTVQTMHIRKGTSCDHEADPIAAALYGSRNPPPGRVLLTNLALITVHTMVTSWLDDKVAEHAHDDNAGPWYIGRVVWHGASLLAEGSAVLSNRARGCAL